MSESDAHEFDRRLLDLHLGHLSVAEQAELRKQIAENPALAAQDEALSGVFAALRGVPDETAPAGLRERVLNRVRAAGPPPRVVRPAKELAAELERRPERVIRLGNLRDLVAVAALIVLAVGLGFPSLMHMRERGQRMGCSYNMAQLGRGVQQYATASLGSLPFAGWGPQSSWRPTSDPNIVTVPNRRHVYLLLGQRIVADPQLFICPSQRGVPMPKSTIGQQKDFLEGRNLSYAYQNMAGVRPSVNDDRRLPILADENPLFENGLPLFNPRRLLGGREKANSLAHDGAGQNILTLDGRVKWVTSPFSGIDGDNIWTLRGVAEYTGHEGPASHTDSHLLK
jgi:hypothetical protein